MHGRGGHAIGFLQTILIELRTSDLKKKTPSTLGQKGYTRLLPREFRHHYLTPCNVKNLLRDNC